MEYVEPLELAGIDLEPSKSEWVLKNKAGTLTYQIFTELGYFNISLRGEKYRLYLKIGDMNNTRITLGDFESIADAMTYAHNYVCSIATNLIKAITPMLNGIKKYSENKNSTK